MEEFNNLLRERKGEWVEEKERCVGGSISWPNRTCANSHNIKSQISDLTRSPWACVRKCLYRMKGWKIDFYSHTKSPISALPLLNFSLSYFHDQYITGIDAVWVLAVLQNTLCYNIASISVCGQQVAEAATQAALAVHRKKTHPLTL